jgi:hypothetical protein
LPDLDPGDSMKLFRTVPFAVLFALPLACGGSSVDFPVDPGTDTGGGGDDTATGGDSKLPDGVSPDGVVVDTAPVDTWDPEKDGDGDGYKAKDDCDDGNPLVNPGAFEVPGDKIDNDCDGAVDNAEPDCDLGDLKLDSTDALDFAKALGLCRTTTADATGKDKKWGVLSAKLVAVDGSGAVDVLQHGIHQKFGTVIKPKQGKNLVALSSGTARQPTDPGFLTPLSPSWSGTSKVTPPSGFPKNAPGCADPTDKLAYDSVALQLTIRVPTNAKSFHYDFDFFTSEYITFVCSAYNDQYIAILDSKAPLDAKYDKNISFDPKGNPINVNYAPFLDVCTPGTKGSLTFTCPKGTKELEGTGFWDSSRTTENASTSWLTTQAALQPGETMTISFMIWDVGDHILDSTVLLDDFRWDTDTIASPVTNRPK